MKMLLKFFGNAFLLFLFIETVFLKSSSNIFVFGSFMYFFKMLKL